MVVWPRAGSSVCTSLVFVPFKKRKGCIDALPGHDEAVNRAAWADLGGYIFFPGDTQLSSALRDSRGSWPFGDGAAGGGRRAACAYERPGLATDFDECWAGRAQRRSFIKATVRRVSRRWCRWAEDGLTMVRGRQLYRAHAGPSVVTRSE
jgi:hypothetical protein